MIRRAMLALPFTAALLSGALAAAPAVSQELPAGFVRERIGSGFDGAISLAWIDEHRLLVGERGGRVWYVDHGVTRGVVHDLSAVTNHSGNRGLFGLAVAPDFDATGWIYLLHSVRVPGEVTWGPGYARLLRVRAVLDEQGALVAPPESRQILLGETWATGIASCVDDHTLGSLRFLSDGSLVLSTGDNTHPGLDTGGEQPDCFLPGRTPLEQDVGAYRSQLLDSLDGKVLRVDPETGLGLADNPFFSGDPADLRSRVWARGLRNAFRFTLLPGSGPREALLVADVGWNTWEEIDLVVGGENFGWPCFEGLVAVPQYQEPDPRGFCAGLVPAPPIVSWHHSSSSAAGFVGQCASALCVYRGDRYPAVYRGRLFFLDFERGWLRAAALDDDLRVRDMLLFGTQFGAPVELVAQPGTGDLVYIMSGSQVSSVFRIRYVGDQHPPTAAASATPSFGPGDLDVTLSAAGSLDPEGLPLVYAWDLGDGTSSDVPVVQHHYAAGAAYRPRLTVTDSEGLGDSAELLVTPGNTPPRILELVTPRDGDTFVAGEAMRVLARLADDEEDPPADVLWTLDLVHDHHVHPDWASAEGASTSLVPDAHPGGDTHFVVRLKVTDSLGLTVERALEIFDAQALPRAHLVELATDSVRVGQALRPVGHVEYSLGRVTPKQATLRWDWGDGTSDVVPDSPHQVDSRPTHVYARPGTYKLQLSAELAGHTSHVQSAEIRVARPWPAVAIFAPVDAERWIPRAEQEAIVAALRQGLAPHTSAVRAFRQGEGAALADWMEALLADALPDVLVLLDVMPGPLVAGGLPGSLLERWVACGNGLVWTGQTPFQGILNDDGTTAQTVLGADAFFGATAPFLVLGEGLQHPTAAGQATLPSLPSFPSSRALRYDQLGPAWRVARLFAEDGDHDSDALELEHLSGHGFYAQFLCTEDPLLPRAAVLAEYLVQRVQRSRLAPPAVRR
jgi:glucose/arabinose dehydrogenase